METAQRNYIRKNPKFPVINKTGDTVRVSKLELDVVALMAQGMTSRDMAEVVFLCPTSVDNVKIRVIRKLAVKNSCEAVAYCIRSGIIQ